MAQQVYVLGIPNIVLIGLPNLASLERTHAKIRAANIRHCAWREPDYDFGFTAIATEPLIGERRAIFKNYRVLHARSSMVEQPPLSRPVVGSSPTARANAGECADTSSARV